MKDKGKIYKYIHFFIIIAAFISFFQILKNNGNIVWNNLNGKDIIWILLLFTFMFLLEHMIKVVRFYMILIEEKINFYRFLKVYLKTTFVNIVLPYKTGELFRIYCYTKETKNYKIGILSVLVERFLDTCVLLVWILPAEIFEFGKLSFLSAILLGTVLGCIIIYYIFPIFYSYLNKFLILYVKTKKSIYFLEILEKLYDWNMNLKELLKGRSSLLIILSGVAWAIEYFMLCWISKICGENFGLLEFNYYINAAFFNAKNVMVYFYTLYGSCILGAVTILFYLIKKEGKKYGEKNSNNL